ncbi:hypothetical protein EYF80_054213 [Liparis tanakae]|uniref:Uncharacterized protein n=1 Tax=Liparis tanakae TaxID=230148 RepID=A0A4Z2F413_9TELE|nr:hypothetical protein EYF80_054213 [Liparis tanakae]
MEERDVKFSGREPNAFLSVPLLPAALPPPPEEARLPGRGAAGLAGSTLRLITPLILGLPVESENQRSYHMWFLAQING